MGGVRRVDHGPRRRRSPRSLSWMSCTISAAVEAPRRSGTNSGSRKSRAIFASSSRWVRSLRASTNTSVSVRLPSSAPNGIGASSLPTARKSWAASTRGRIRGVCRSATPSGSAVLHIASRSRMRWTSRSRSSGSGKLSRRTNARTTGSGSPPDTPKITFRGSSSSLSVGGTAPSPPVESSPSCAVSSR